MLYLVNENEEKEEGVVMLPVQLSRVVAGFLGLLLNLHLTEVESPFK